MSSYKPEGLLLETAENKQHMRSAAALQEACLTNKTLEARAVVCDSEHNLVVDLGIMRGVIPREEGALGIIDGTAKDIAIISRVNKAVCFKVLSLEADSSGKPIAILSRRLAQEECRQSYLAKLRSGDVIPARVTHLEPFGAFVDIGCGIPSLIPIDSISVSRIMHPKDRFRCGQDIYAVVRSIDEAGRICLSHKELLGTWAQNSIFFAPGQTVAGIIRSVEEYGVFVELAPNLAGLAELKEDVAAGQHASVYIKSLIPEKMKVKLIIVDSFEVNNYTPTFSYFITEGHIDRFQYSPDCCSKVVETVFE
ncbi:S1 RNA-binding domain-containing protein [Acetanaerobacterium elongatum]|uniref:Small subunit ribosomal protein S1 n=1 Tax=Acetanaerobacterium elongatum TaxID=258515 RepID=A0A1G9X0D4_9FIRM|nr:S1 RNA-binding domain-containing protein [Acetanaerobacterium elongatum]SDM90199.1 small subunit ribosomal protein S1 [Acetanaerobacterium elongatum]